MISLVDSQELERVLRPTVYRPFGVREERSSAPRQDLDSNGRERRFMTQAAKRECVPESAGG
jgi:hypothetical protein